MKLRTAVLVTAVIAGAAFSAAAQTAGAAATNSAPVLAQKLPQVPPRQHKTAPSSVPLSGAFSIVAQKAPQWHSAFAFAPAKPSENYKIERAGRMSSQAWTTIACEQPGGASPFLSEETQEPKLYVVWFGHDPWR